MRKLILIALITFINCELKTMDSCLWQAISGGGYKGKVGLPGLIACFNNHTINLKSAKQLEDAYMAFLNIKNDVINYFNSTQTNVGTMGPSDLWNADGSMDILSWAAYESIRLLCQGCQELELTPLDPNSPIVQSTGINYGVSCKVWNPNKTKPSFCTNLNLTKNYLDLSYQEYMDYLNKLQNNFLTLGVVAIYGVAAGIKTWFQAWDPGNTHDLEILALKE